MKLNLIKCKNSVSMQEYCLNAVTELKKNDENSRVIIIVPEQFSYSVEKLITTHFGGTGLNGIDVLTFSRLCSYFLPRVKKDCLLDSGKTILIQNAIYSQCKNEENIYSGCINKQGLIKEFNSIFAEFTRYMITPDILYDVGEKSEEGLLKNKIISLADIYKYYLDKIGNRFYDNDEDLVFLADKIKEEKLLNDVYIIFYEFSDFLPKHYNVIESMLKTTKGMYFTIPWDDYNEEMMEIPKDTLKRLTLLANKNSITPLELTYKSDNKQFNSLEIEFYNKHFAKQNKGFVPFENQTGDIEIFAARDLFSEVQRIARQIRTLVEKKNYRYSDISVVFGNEKEYSNVIEAVFNENEIPYFSDTAIPVSEHPVSMAALGIFNIVENNFSYDSVFSYLKSGFVFFKSDDGIKPISRDDIDLIETFVLKNGIRGKNKWISDKDWIYNDNGLTSAIDESKSKDIQYSEKINEIRKTITKPIEVFVEKISGRKTVRQMVCAYYEFLRDIYLYEGILEEIRLFDLKGLRNEAEQFLLVWNMIVEVLNQLEMTLGDEKCTKKEFLNYLYAGLTSCNINIIPSSLDSVTVGTADSVRQKSVKALFVAGSIRGYIPMETVNEGVLSDKERDKLKEILASDNIELGQSTKDIKNASKYRFFRVLFMASDNIFISYPVNDFNGEALIPSQFIFDLNKIFKNVTKHDDLLFSGDYDNLIYTEKAAFNYLIENRKNTANSQIKELENRFLDKEEWKEKLKIIKKADEFKKGPLSISEKNAKSLYDNLSGYSVTRLNEFSACPFKYFLKYGLRAKEQEVWQIRKLDLGTIMHLAVCRFCLMIENGAKNFDELKNNWLNLTKKECEELIDKVMSEILTSVLVSIDKDEAKIKYLMARMTKMIKRAVQTICLSLKNGEYVAVEHEKVFKVKLTAYDESINIKGTIDRIDIAKTNDGVAKLRIIDYKSGKKDYSVVSIANMLDIQLVVYAACAQELYTQGKIKYCDKTTRGEICGIMYNKIRDDMKRVEMHEIKEADRYIDDIMRLDGVVILDKDNKTQEYSLENALMMDKTLADNKTSEFLNIKVTSDGKLYKNADVSLREEFDSILNYVKNNIIRIDKRIKNGDIEIRPYKNNTMNACSYCDMAEICLFDEEYDKVRPICTTTDEAWDIIKNL